MNWRLMGRARQSRRRSLKDLIKHGHGSRGGGPPGAADHLAVWRSPGLLGVGGGDLDSFTVVGQPADHASHSVSCWPKFRVGPGHCGRSVAARPGLESLADRYLSDATASELPQPGPPLLCMTDGIRRIALNEAQQQFSRPQRRLESNHSTALTEPWHGRPARLTLNATCCRSTAAHDHDQTSAIRASPVATSQIGE